MQSETNLSTMEAEIVALVVTVANLYYFEWK